MVHFSGPAAVSGFYSTSKQCSLFSLVFLHMLDSFLRAAFCVVDRTRLLAFPRLGRLYTLSRE
jgi:hypothetical protein